MFDGKARQPSRSVSMGGFKKESSTKELVDKSRKLREQRLEEKQKQNAAIRIQSLWRGSKSRKAFQSQLMMELDQKVDGITKIKKLFAARNQMFNVPLETLLTLFRLYSLCYTRQRNQDNVPGGGGKGHCQFMYSLYLESISNPSVVFNLLSKLINDGNQSSQQPQSPIWNYYITNILTAVLRIIDDDLIMTAQSSSSLSSISFTETVLLIFKFTFLVCKCDNSTITYSSNIMFQNALSNILESVMIPLCAVLRKLILKQQSSHLINLIILMLNLVVRSLCESSLSSVSPSSSSISRKSIKWQTTITVKMVTPSLLTLPDIHNLVFMRPLIEYMNEHDYEGWRIALKSSCTSTGDSICASHSIDTGVTTTNPTRGIVAYSNNDMERDQPVMQFTKDQLMKSSVLRNFIRCVLIDNSKTNIKGSQFSLAGLNIISSPISCDISDSSKGGLNFFELVYNTIKYAPTYTVLKLMETGNVDNTEELSSGVGAASSVMASDYSGVKYIEFTLYKYHQSIKKREAVSFQRQELTFTPPSSSSATSSFQLSTPSMIKASTSYISQQESKRQQIQRMKTSDISDDRKYNNYVGRAESLDPLADLLTVMVANADLLSVTLNDCLQLLGSSSQKRSFDNSLSTNHNQSSSSFENNVINIAKKNSVLFGLTVVYMKILTLSSTSIDSDSPSTTALIKHNTASSSSSSVKSALLSDAYINIGTFLGSSLLNTFAFSHAQSKKSMSQRLWKYLTTFSTEIVLEALMLREDFVAQNIDKYTNSITGFGNNNINLFGKSSTSSSSSSLSLSIASRCTRDFSSAAQSVGLNSDDLCAGLSTVFWLFCSVFVHQLAATDDEELFESQGNVAVEDIVCIVLLLKKLLYRLYCSTSSAAATVSKLLKDTWDSQSSTFGSSSKSTTDIRATVWTKEIIDFEAQVVSRQHQLWIYTRLFNALFAVNLRRPYMNADDWQWSDVSALAPDMDRKIQELANTMTDSSDNSSGSDSGKATDMSQLLANDNMKAVLSCIPQVIPFPQRISVFQTLIALDSHKRVSPATLFGGGSTKIQIHRSHILEDSMDQLSVLNESKLKGRIQVEFIAETGMVEAGIDGGGLFKAFLDLFMKQAFDPSLGLFVISQDQLLTPNPGSALAMDNHLQYFHFIGKMLGIAVYNRILVEPQLTGTFLNTLLGKSNHINELHYLDKQILHSLMELKHMASAKAKPTTKSSSDGIIGSEEKLQSAESNDIDPIANLGLLFEVDRVGAYDSLRVTEELIPNGADTLVTKQNVHSYIHRYAHFKLNLETAQQTRAFLSGFRQLIPTDWLPIFSTQELQLVISGEHKPIDIVDLRCNVNYVGGYTDSDPYIQEFWKIVESLDVRQQGLLLKFITSCSRQPLLGFSKLNPHIGIQKIACYNYDTVISTVAQAPRLPSAATCMNLLKLPYYDSIEILKEKLLYAINSESGFELS